MDNNTIRLFSSRKTDNWQTPKYLYNQLNMEFNFDCDPCPLNSQIDGLLVNWGKRCFVNPPYSKVKQFLEKAHEELSKETELCVFLVFANTDTKWFHDYIYNKSNVEIRFLKGRLKFLDENGKLQNSAMRPSMICIFRKL